MITININDIPRDLPGYLQRLQAGETVLIVQDDQLVGTQTRGCSAFFGDVAPFRVMCW